jgi:uncharacterized membrane protein YhaH (DUF805 family)
MDWRHLFLGLEGRISRKPFWIGTGVLFAVGLASLFLQSHLDAPRPAAILGLALLYPEFAVTMKRARDRDMSLLLPALLLVLGVVAYALDFFGFTGTDASSFEPYDLFAMCYLLLSVYLLVVLGFFKGTPGPNRFGPNPLETRIS